LSPFWFIRVTHHVSVYYPLRVMSTSPLIVMPAQTGIHAGHMDSRLCGNDGE